MERARAFAAEIAARAACETTLAGPLGVEGLKVALWSGDTAAAVELFEAAEGIQHAADDSDPNMAWWRMEHAEALLEETGQVDEQRSRASTVEQQRVNRAPVAIAPGR